MVILIADCGGIIMKKVKKFLSILSAVMVFSACAASAVYADETATEPTESTETTEPTNEKITDSNVICDMINEFIKTEGIPGAHASTASSDSQVLIHMDYDIYLENGEYMFSNLIYDYLDKNNVDRTKVGAWEPLWYLSNWYRDVNGDDKINVRDCAFIASKLAKGEELSDRADCNLDGKADVRDAAVLAGALAWGKGRVYNR